MNIEWAASLEEALERSQEERKMVLGYFRKDPCPQCDALNRDTLSDPDVQQFIAKEFVPAKIYLNRRGEARQFREYGVLWTPSLVVMDWRGRAHYQSPGYLPPQPFLSMLHIGLARALMPWSRYDEASAYLEEVAQQPDDRFAPEALFWLGIARYIGERSQTRLDEAWDHLEAEHPDSVWAARIPPSRIVEPAQDLA